MPISPSCRSAKVGLRPATPERFNLILVAVEIIATVDSGWTNKENSESHNLLKVIYTAKKDLTFLQKYDKGNDVKQHPYKSSKKGVLYARVELFLVFKRIGIHLDSL